MSKLADGSPKQAVSESHNEKLAIEISPEVDAAMRELKELFFLIPRYAAPPVSAAGPKDQRSLTSCSSQSSMSSSAMIQIVNTNGGSDAFMRSA